jgi:site-specific DNA-methyltransferase (adenine-specific)
MPPKKIKLIENQHPDIEIKNQCGLEYLNGIENNSVDLILTDPPYIISKESGMDNLHNKLEENEKSNGGNIKSEQEWDEYKKTLKNPQNEIDAGKGKGWSKENYIKYGHIQGKKYATKTKFGKWDEEFDMEMLDKFIELYYKKLRKGGTCIIFFDIWKITTLKELLEKHKFKQIRFIEWIKTNPQPINSKVNYLSNSREIALLGVKGGKPTFNSSYDNGMYKCAKCSGKTRFHPTQKPISLFEDIIKKHSNETDLVMDTFLGGGTTAFACKNINRNFKGCEISKEYYDKIIEMC